MRGAKSAYFPGDNLGKSTYTALKDKDSKIKEEEEEHSFLKSESSSMSSPEIKESGDVLANVDHTKSQNLQTTNFLNN